jgi:N-acetylmuramoyl-L-alanine amidase
MNKKNIATVALDNGHGLKTPGKRTPVFTDGTRSTYTKKNFMHEWEFNRGVVKRMVPLLEKNGFDALEVSPVESDTKINDRCKLANNSNADIFISIHANALGSTWNENVKGIETLVGGSESKKLGSILQKHMVKSSGLNDRGLKDGKWLGVVKGTKMPAVLVECGFMDNPTEARLLLSSEYRDLMAVSLVKGICEYFGVAYK